MAAFNKKQYKRARGLFRSLLPLYLKRQQQQKRGTRLWHVWLLGRSNLRYFLGRIALARGNKLVACVHFTKQLNHTKKVPKSWPSWGMSRKLLIHFKTAKRLHAAKCVETWNTLQLVGTPVNIKAWTKADGKWKQATLRRGGEPGMWFLRTKQKKINLRIKAKGHRTQEWSSVKLTELKKLQYQLAPQSGKPTQLPIYKKPWFWVVVVGSTAAVVTTVGLILGLSNPGSSAPNGGEVLTGPRGSGPFILWKR